MNKQKKTKNMLTTGALAASMLGVLLLGTPAAANAAPVQTAVQVTTSVTASSPVPGRFCSRADRGKVVKTAKYGKVQCKADRKNSRYSRWYQI